MKILIIDDEKPTLQMPRLFLEACGYEVYAAENESQGMSQFKEIAPAVVLTDIKMPGKDRLVVLTEIKAIAPQAEVIVITGHGDKNPARQAKDLGASAFFNKPLDTDAMDRTIKKIEARLSKDGALPGAGQ